MQLGAGDELGLLAAQEGDDRPEVVGVADDAGRNAERDASGSPPYNAVIRAVAWIPGCTVLTVTPSAATSPATVFRNAVAPALAVFDRISVAIGCRTDSEVMATTRPHRLACIAGIAALHIPTMLSRLRSMPVL